MLSKNMDERGRETEGHEMTHSEARQVLDSVKDGADPTVQKITEALKVLGDL